MLVTTHQVYTDLVPMLVTTHQVYTDQVPMLVTTHQVYTDQVFGQADECARAEKDLRPLTQEHTHVRSIRHVAVRAARTFVSLYQRATEDNDLAIKDTVPLTNPGVSHLRIRGDSKIVASGGWDGSVRIFGWKMMKPLAVLQHHKDLVHCVVFSDHPEPSKRLMAAGSKDQRISIWSIYTER
ncbi:guanine nucleotide-binding protein subunit beta-like protein 1 [Tachysurus ichikawai]